LSCLAKRFYHKIDALDAKDMESSKLKCCLSGCGELGNLAVSGSI
jgi:hypothetical protein